MERAKEPITTRFFVLPIISGAFLMGALPLFHLSFLLWFAFAPLFFFVARESISYKRAFQGGMITGVVYLSVVVYPLMSLNAWWWLQARGVVYENKIIFLFWILYTAVLAGSLLFGIFAIIFKKLQKEEAISVFLLAFIWVVLEYARAKIVFGFTWGHLGYGLHGSPDFLQLARLEGVYSLSFLIVVINLLIYFGIKNVIRYVQKRDTPSIDTLIRGVVIEWRFYAIPCIVAGVMFYGHSMLTKKDEKPPKNIFSASIVQTGENKTPLINEEKIFQMMEESLKDNPMLLVTPESSFPTIIINEDTMELLAPSFPIGMTPQQGESAYAKILKISENHPTTSFVVGAETLRGKSHYNSSMVIEEGKVKNIYHKRELFPFSEHSPSWFPFGAREPLAEGDRRQDITIQGKHASFALCSEILFPEIFEDDGSDFIIAIGNDGVFDSSLVAEQNHIIAKFVAVETGKHIIRAMKTGVSSIIDPRGRETTRSQSSAEEFLVGQVSY